MRIPSPMLTLVVLVATMTACTPTVDRATADVNKRLVRDYIERLINEGDWSAWPALFGDSVSFNGQPMSREDMRAMAETFRSIFPDLRMQVESQIAEGDVVATRVTIFGTHRGGYMGIEATGQEVSFSGLTYDRIEDGRIVEMWHEMDIWGTLLMLED